LLRLSIRARVVIAVLSAAALAGGAMLAWAVDAQRRAAIAQARDFAQSVHQLTVAGLTGMMLTGTGAQRSVFLEQIEHANSIRSLRVVRGPAVARQYGPGTSAEQPADDLEARVIADGGSLYDVVMRDGTEHLRAVMPVIAQSDYLGKNCLACHAVPEGTQLGAITLEVELARNRAFVAEFQNGMIGVGMLLFVPLGVLSWIAVNAMVTMPLRRLSANLDEIARGDAALALRLPARGGTELVQAAESFNRVLEKAAQMLARERISSDVFDHALEGIVVADRDGRIVKVNRAFTRTTGYSEDEAVGNNPRMLQSGRHDAAFYGAFWHALTTRGEWQGEIWNRRKDGEEYAELLNVSAVRGRSGEVEHYVAIFSDITERKRQEAANEHRAYHDALTSLPNRLLFHDRLEQALARARRNATQAAVMFLDLDRFKAINDTLGHRVGDLVLKEIASRLRDTVRDTDTVARLGGDEFTVLLPEVPGIEAAEAVAHKIVEAMRVPLRIGEHEIAVTASVGIALFPRDGEDASALMKNADASMYEVKGDGRAGFRVYTRPGAKEGRARRAGV
jgi:diguanylate cyclase (GGDEF)-like protein/PAS domain S-box-containing protein